MSAARQRLLGRTRGYLPRSQGRRTVWRVLGWSLTLAIIAAAIFGAVALKLRWPTMRSLAGMLHGLPTQSPSVRRGRHEGCRSQAAQVLVYMCDPGPLEIRRRIWTSSSIRQATQN